MKGGVAAFQKELLHWYEEDARDLPWRRTKDPYCVYLSEIILQQTRVDQGLPYYNRFLERFPTLQALAIAGEQDVLKAWEGLGYYTRARNMHRAANIVVEEYAGRFPDSPELLRLLPGIGKYTAGAIASIAFGKPVPVLDGNVKRVLARLDAFEASIDLPASDQLLWQRAESLVPVKSPGDYTQAMMELGARICVPKSPMCDACPVRKFCDGHARSLQHELPKRTPKKSVPHQEVVVAAIYQDGRYLIGKRPSEGFLGGLWEFPGGKINTGENTEAALLRECREELRVKVRVGGLVAVVKHAYTHFKVTLHVYRCTISSGKPKPQFHTALKWVSPEEFDEYAFPKGNHKFLRLL